MGSLQPQVVPPGIEPAALAGFFAARVPGGDAPLAFRLIGDGRSNLTYLVEGGGRRWVLRRPPLGHVLPTAHDMAREHRVMLALADTDVPVPRPLALCEDAALLGAPFYVMEHRPGVVLEEALPPDWAGSPDACRRISLALVDALARLHAVDFRAVGLADFGRPDGYLERQVRRWGQQWERSKTRPLPELDALAARLAAALPASPAPAIVHGDFRLGNLALDPVDSGRVVAIYDWEMATLGDPLADLGYTLIWWAEAGDTEMRRDRRMALTAAPGFLSRRELSEAYARASGRGVGAVEFYQVLALYKLAIISEGILARHLQGKTVGEGFDGYESQTAALARRALAIADASQDLKLRGG
jgi:aminoglycoside phosphotransferase (APT) family kinase protein